MTFYMSFSQWHTKPTLQQQSPLAGVKNWIQNNTEPDAVIGINSEEVNLFARSIESNKISPDLALLAKNWFEHRVGRRVFYERKMTTEPNNAHKKQISWQMTVEYNRFFGTGCKSGQKATGIQGCKAINGFVMKWKRVQK